MLACLFAGPALSLSLDVTVTGIQDDIGTLACTLHDEASGFPDRVPVAVLRVPPRSGQARCLFDGLAPGRYAVAVLHDANDNGRMDMNLLGMPIEAWGVSRAANGPLNRLRAPQFDEAAFDFGPEPGRLRIRLSR